ncbi:hypothetical protein BJY52DRAFT_681787 [Lactarius psammicola]|nr:hypothetical protein BJY52DRAFT_681787 [Lactarius psammicola]
MTTTQSSIQNPHETTSVQSTPGLEIPGAYPQEHTSPTRQRPLSGSHRVSDPQPISLPSTEKEGTHPGEHCGGVGPLPGSISETSVAKLPDERASERKAASAPASRSKEIYADTDHGGDPREAVAATGAKVPGERESEREAASESFPRSKELAADTGRGDDETKGVAVAAAEAPGVTSQDSPVRRNDPQGPDAVGEQVPAEQRAETRDTADTSAPADSKFKEELRREEKSGVVSDEGPQQQQQQQPSRAAAAEDPAPSKGGEEDPNKASAVQQQRQQQQPEIAGGHAPRKERSHSDTEAKNRAKATMMNRVRGGMMMLLGKASGNREKVDEGERLKHGVQ